MLYYLLIILGGYECYKREKEAFMRSAQHNHIVNVYNFGYFNTNECSIPYIALEICNNGILTIYIYLITNINQSNQTIYIGELFEYVSALGGLSMSVCKRFLIQLISALKHLHDNGIYHRLLYFTIDICLFTININLFL